MINLRIGPLRRPVPVRSIPRRPGRVATRPGRVHDTLMDRYVHKTSAWLMSYLRSDATQAYAPRGAVARSGDLSCCAALVFCFAPQTPGAHSVGLAYAPRGAVARSGDLSCCAALVFCFAPQTPGTHSVGLAYAPQGARPPSRATCCAAKARPISDIRHPISATTDAVPDIFHAA